MAGAWKKAIIEAVQKFPEDPAKCIKLAKGLYKEKSKAAKVLKTKVKKPSMKAAANVITVMKVMKASAMKAAPKVKGAGPSGFDKIVFQQDNPKAPKGTAFARYEKYKAATTVDDALRRGAALGDVKFDFLKGFLKKA